MVLANRRPRSLNLSSRSRKQSPRALCRCRYSFLFRRCCLEGLRLRRQRKDSARRVPGPDARVPASDGEAHRLQSERAFRKKSNTEPTASRAVACLGVLRGFALRSLRLNVFSFGQKATASRYVRRGGKLRYESPSISATAAPLRPLGPRRRGAIA